MKSRTLTFTAMTLLAALGGWVTHSKCNSKSHIKVGAPSFRVLCGRVGSENAMRGSRTIHYHFQSRKLHPRTSAHPLESPQFRSAFCR
jgi:hypothetical protein